MSAVDRYVTCRCGCDRWEDTTVIRTHGKTITFTGGLRCENCGLPAPDPPVAAVSSGGNQPSLEEADEPNNPVLGI